MNPYLRGSRLRRKLFGGQRGESVIRFDPDVWRLRLRKWHQGRRGSLACELRQGLFALTDTETTDAALSGDPGALHGRSGAGLAEDRPREDDQSEHRLSATTIFSANLLCEPSGA